MELQMGSAEGWSDSKKLPPVRSHEGNNIQDRSIDIRCNEDEIKNSLVYSQETAVIRSQTPVSLHVMLSLSDLNAKFTLDKLKIPSQPPSIAPQQGRCGHCQFEDQWLPRPPFACMALPSMPSL
jgi:hypothetical protein